MFEQVLLFKVFIFLVSEPQTKKFKPNPIEKKATSSWQEDSRNITDLPQEQQNPEYRRHWHQIRTRVSRQNRLLDWYNYRLSSLQPREIILHLDEIFADKSTVFNLFNVSFGFLLRNNETGDLEYYYAFRNNEQVFEAPFQIATATDLRQVRESLQNLDVLEWVRQRRPNSKLVVDTVTNITFVTKLRGHPVGRGTDLPVYLAENHGLVALDRNRNHGKVYSDNLCFFRALAFYIMIIAQKI